jgi:hypothetical protein
MMALLDDLIGRRVLIKRLGRAGYANPGVEEARVEEISPSKQWVKLMTMYGNKFWKPVSDVAVIEVLKDMRCLEPVPQESKEE